MSADNSMHREVKVLSLHEVGWCHLIQLNFAPAQNTFTYLKSASRWSRSFYAYLSSICAGACNAQEETSFLLEVRNSLEKSFKGCQLEKYLRRRFKLFPTSIDDPRMKEPLYWKLLIYEVLYLWNTLPSCNAEDINRIIGGEYSFNYWWICANSVLDCNMVAENHIMEPTPGISKMIEGNCYCILRNFDKGVSSFRECLEMRKNIPNNSFDAHVSAFSQFELGVLLVQNTEVSCLRFPLANISCYNTISYVVD